MEIPEVVAEAPQAVAAAPQAVAAVPTQAAATGPCGLCKDGVDLDFLTAPKTTLLCGHQFHTRCVMNDMALNHMRTLCSSCNTRVMTEDTLNTIYRGHQPNVGRLWRENEEFRADIIKLKKSLKEFNPLKKEYNKQILLIKRRYNDNIRTSIEMIKDQKRQAINSAKAIEFRRRYLFYFSKVRNSYRNLGKYNVYRQDLRELNTMEGVPKINYNTRHNSYRNKLDYIFRTRI